MTTFTIIGYKPNSEYYNRCGDRWSYDSDLEIFSTTDENEAALKLAHFMTYETKDYEDGYEPKLLIDGNEEFPGEWGSDEHHDFDAIRDKIMSMAEAKKEEAFAERKRKAEAAEEVRKQAELQRKRQADLAREQAQRAEYERLAAIYGGRK